MFTSKNKINLFRVKSIGSPSQWKVKSTRRLAHYNYDEYGFFIFLLLQSLADRQKESFNKDAEIAELRSIVEASRRNEGLDSETQTINLVRIIAFLSPFFLRSIYLLTYFH